MKKIHLIAIACCALGAVGCHHEQVVKGPIKGSVNLDGLTPDQKMAKIQSDNSIPDRYKQLYITSEKAKSGQSSPPPGGPGTVPGAGQ